MSTLGRGISKAPGPLQQLEKLGVKLVFMQDLIKTDVPGIVDFAKAVGCEAMACATKNGTSGKFIKRTHLPMERASLDSKTTKVIVYKKKLSDAIAMPDKVGL